MKTVLRQAQQPIRQAQQPIRQAQQPIRQAQQPELYLVGERSRTI